MATRPTGSLATALAMRNAWGPCAGAAVPASGLGTDATEAYWRREGAMKRFTYTSRDGQTYYPHVVQRTDGRDIYVMRKRRDGALRLLPAGYEVRESIQGRVSVRRKRPRLISAAEERLLRSALAQSRPFAYELDVEGRSATVYASAQDRKCFAESLDAEFADGFADALTKTLAKRYPPELVAMFRARRRRQDAKRPRFYPLLRFVIADRTKRLFAVERVCFTGESSWIRLEVLPLSAAVMKYLPHLGRDSFFDLM